MRRISFSVMELHTFFSGNIDFLSIVTCHQGYVASFLCYYCYAKIDKLQKGETNFDLRTKQKQCEHVNEVHIKKNKNKAATKGSMIH